MRANAILFWILSVFFLLSAIVYTLWSLIDPMHGKVEWVGTRSPAAERHPLGVHRLLRGPLARLAGR